MNSIVIKLSHKTYPLYIKRGLINEIGIEIAKIYNGRKIAIITDDNVNKLYGRTVEISLKTNNFNVKTFVLAPGEKSKSVDVLLGIYNDLLDFGLTRGDLIIALGGGVVGDLTGFAASTLLRGIPFVQIPTSLLAQVDSSIGGKVAVDLPKGKNLIGSFYHPQAVFIDPNVLKTLSEKFLHDGLAEVIKYGAIKDSDLFLKLENLKDDQDLLENIDDVIYKCCTIKKDLVEKDEKDTGDRMILNFGHTIGHSIEKYFDYEKYTHGEAVAIGMYSITKRSEELGVTEPGSAERIKNILIKYKLPYEVLGLDNDKILDAIGLDKKNDKDTINIILLKKLGDVFIENINSSLMKDYI